MTVIKLVCTRVFAMNLERQLQCRTWTAVSRPQPELSRLSAKYLQYKKNRHMHCTSSE